MRPLLPSTAAVMLVLATVLAGCVGNDPEQSVNSTPSTNASSAPADPGAGNGTDPGDTGEPMEPVQPEEPTSDPEEPATGDGPENVAEDPEDPAPEDEREQTADASTWPHEGSTVRYHVHQGGGSPGGVPYSTWNVTLLFTFEEGAWTASCIGTVEHKDRNGSRTEPVDVAAAIAPPHAPTDVAVNDEVTVRGFDARCEPTTHDVVVRNETAFAAHVDGEGVRVNAWRAFHEPACECQADEAHWDTASGLVLHWWFGGQSGGVEGRLVSTDAPLAVTE